MPRVATSTDGGASFEALGSWAAGRSRDALLRFVDEVTDPGSRHYLPPEERVAAFDNDGTLTCERPTVQGAFILQRLAAVARADQTLASKDPWAAALGGDLDWVDRALTKHYQGDDADLKVLLEAVLTTFSELSVERFAAQVTEFFETAQHPRFVRPFTEVVYRPMRELLDYLASNDFTCYIVSGGGRDFLRPISQSAFGIPPERVVGSAPTMVFSADVEPAEIIRQPSLDILDDGPAKAIYLWDRAGRRPILAAGNADGDIPLLHYAGMPGEPRMRMVIVHDDADREFAYALGSDLVRRMAAERDWTVVSMKRDWERIL
jgi:phosphoserine phosphatase